MMKRFLIASLSLFFMQPLIATAESVMVTSQNIKSLLNNKNAKISAAKEEKSAAAEREGSLRRSFLPSVSIFGAQESFKIGYLPNNNQGTSGVEAKMNLFNGGQDQIENDVRVLETKKLEVQEQKIRSEELLKARVLYWQALFLREKIGLLQTTFEMNKQNMNSAKRRIRSGVATDSDRFEFEMKEVDLKREILKAQMDFNGKSEMLAVVLGIESGAELAFAEPFVHEHQYEDFLKHSSEQREFLYKDFEILSVQQALSAKGSRRAWWPKIDAFAGYNEYSQRIESAGPDASSDLRKETVLGLRITLNLDSGLESNVEAKTLEKKSLASMLLANYQKREVEVFLQAEKNNLKFLHDQVHEAEQNISRAERYYKMTQSEYSRGAKNSPDVSGASDKLFDIKLQRLEIIKDFQISKAQMLARFGQ